MTITHYKDLIVWQKSVDLVDIIYRICASLPKTELYGLCSQMQRSAVSIPSNIAEGQARNHTGEFRQFLGIAYGSSAELETQLIITKRQYPSTDIEQASMLLVEIQKMLITLIRKLDTRH